MCIELFKKIEDFQTSSIDHLQRLNNFEIAKDVLIAKIRYLDKIKKPFDYTLCIDSIASFSHAMHAYRTMFVKPSMSNHYTQSTCGDKGKSAKGTNHKNSNFIPICHHWGVSGHIRPNCFQIRSQKPWDKQHVPRKDEPGIKNQVKTLSDQVKLISKKLGSFTPNEKKFVIFNKRKNTTNKQVWIKKEDNLCLVAHTALKILDTYLWYLDSGCSKHKAGDKTILKEIQMGRRGKITYGDRSQSKVIGKGLIDIPGLGASQEALYVEGLKANLISISQFCDNDLVVQFSKKECNIFDSNGKWLMGGEQTIDNCYSLPGLTSEPHIICNKATVDNSELWHQRLGILVFNLDNLAFRVKIDTNVVGTGSWIVYLLSMWIYM